MCASSREFGFKIPCLVRSDGEIVDGHLRLKAARKLGITEIPVILCEEWTAAQVKAFRLMVNRSVTSADWDEELLALELEEIQASDFDLSLTGFDPGEIDKLLALEDDYAPSGLLPHSQKWLEYWDRQIYVSLTNQLQGEPVPFPFEAFRAVIRYAVHSPASLVGSIPESNEWSSRP